MTLTALTSPITTRRTRAHHCVDCRQPITTPGQLCPSCREIQERGSVAAHFRIGILAMIESDEDRWITAALLNRVILRSGYAAPLILLAVAARAAYLEPINYAGVQNLCVDEAAAQGFDFLIF